MQDRFRFRVWKKYNCPSYDKHKPEMFYDAEKTYDFLLNNIPENCFSDILEDEKEYIVMQCTGLEDKNGKLIFEGDIAINEGTVCIIKWDNDKCAFFAETASEYFAFEEDITIEDFEVIGNIYQNPELIEKQEQQCT